MGGEPDALTPEGLALLPAGNAGVPIASPLFGPVALALQALLLHQVLRVSPDMLWQTLIGLNILAAHGLYAPNRQLAPTDTFSFDAATVSAQITGPGLNPPSPRSRLTSMRTNAIPPAADAPF